MKKETIDIKLNNYWICSGQGTEKNCKKIFYNDDDNVCEYCGSKNTSKILNASLRKKKRGQISVR